MAINKSRMTDAMLQSRDTAINGGAGVGVCVLLTAAISCTLSNATNIVQDVAHGLENNDRVKMGGTALPAELNGETYYHVVNKNNDDFQISLTQGGAAVTFTTDGTSVTYEVVGAIIPLKADAFNTPTSDATKSSMTLNITGGAPTASPLKEVTVTNADFCDSDEVPYWQNTVTENPPGTGELIINSSTLATGVAVNLNSLTIDQEF